MPKRTGDFNSSRLESLADPINAANYLNAALEDSPDLFLDALKDVIQARKVSRVAQESGLTRESLYRSFSTNGNPTLDTLRSVLNAMDLRLSGVSPKQANLSDMPSTRAAYHTRRRRKVARRGVAGHPGQLTLPFDLVGIASSTASSGAIGSFRQKNDGIPSTARQENYLGILDVQNFGLPIAATGIWFLPQASESPNVSTYAE